MRLIVKALRRWAQTATDAALARAEQDLAETKAALRVAQEENRRLWELCQRDHARVARERAVEDRVRAECVAATRTGEQQ